jgi:hypothetical protein
MKLAWLTDIHLDFVEDEGIRELGRRIAQTGATAAMVTGDIAIADCVIEKLDILARAAGMPLWFVLGNHDFYGGAIDEVRAEMRVAAKPPLAWVPAHAPCEIAAGTWLVGVDGWGDARLGAVTTTKVMLNDFLRIADVQAAFFQNQLAAKLQALGDAEARLLEQQIARVPAHVDRVLVATHVPPFEAACWYEGRPSAPDWLPYFTCDAVGRVLLDAARAQPTRRYVALCGHTHGAGRAQIAPNLEVVTGGAEYGKPEIAGIVDVAALAVAHARD